MTRILNNFWQKDFSKTRCTINVLIALLFVSSAHGQDDRAQIPKRMQQSYFEINVGAINYPFGQKHMEPGYTLTESVLVPHTAVRLILAGYDFNKYLSAQITYMRPVLWVKYTYSLDADIAQTEYSSTVWMNVGGLTLKPTLPIGKRFSIYGEFGLGIITRHGFEDYAGNPIVKDLNYATFLFGAGVKYRLSDRWAAQICSNFSPTSNKNNQPYTSFLGAGFVCHLTPFSDKKLQKGIANGFINPKQWFQVGYTSNVLGYGVNNFVSEGKVPIFWGGNAEVRQGLTLNYQRNVLHGAKIFALDWGVNTSIWQTNAKRETFFTVSLFPVFRFNFLHSKPVDFYFYYSVAGPTFMSKKVLDDFQMGSHFTFMDNMGLGAFFGEKRNLNAELKIGHYSNGNIFTENQSVKVPLSLNLGFGF